MRPLSLKSQVSLVLLTLAFSGCQVPQTEKPKLKSPVPVGADLPPQKLANQPAAESVQKEPLFVRRARYAIVKLRLDDARTLLQSEVGPDAAAARARLAIYQADCEGAQAQLSRGSVRGARDAEELIELSDSCVGATAGAIILEDKERGVWLRIQDEKDRVLAPLIVDVADRARQALERDLGETLPRPLRIDLVRDLFSLSAVSGLPVDAAETTGTVAVARWGRITMVSPRAMQSGFPWADTLAHEITHLLISRATAERAPLWLQEGIAKREETRWRAPELFDDAQDFSKRAFDAQAAGKSVGVDKIGPSIAMLPSAEAASIAFAEVTSFMGYWIERNGPRSLELLLRDMEVAPDPNSAMRSVSGYAVEEWQNLWRDHLSRQFADAPVSEEDNQEEQLGPRQLGRALRLVELLSVDGRPAAAALRGAVELDRAPHVAALRFLTARAAYLNDDADAPVLLGAPTDVDTAHAGHLALSAFELSRAPVSDPRIGQLLAQAQSLDPLLPEAACGGTPWVGKRTTLPPQADVVDKDLKKQPDLPDPRAEDPLCRAARALPPRGSR